jgi:esterase
MTLAYREQGTGTPLLILHGLFGQSDNWNSLAKRFSEEGFRVFTLDLRNHGLSPHSDNWNYEVMADDINGFINEHQLKQPILMGHSMGAKTLLYFEYKYPSIASKLVLVDMAARSYTPKHNAVIEALLSVNLAELKSRKDAEAILTESINDVGTRQFLLKNLYRTEGGTEQFAWRFNLDVISKKYPAMNEAVPFYKSNVDTLVIKGEASDYVSEKDLQDYQSRFPNFQSENISGAGHWLHAEKPEQFFEAALAFIKA